MEEIVQMYKIVEIESAKNIRTYLPESTLKHLGNTRADLSGQVTHSAHLVSPVSRTHRASPPPPREQSLSTWTSRHPSRTSLFHVKSSRIFTLSIRSHFQLSAPVDFFPRPFWADFDVRISRNNVTSTLLLSVAGDFLSGDDR